MSLLNKYDTNYIVFLYDHICQKYLLWDILYGREKILSHDQIGFLKGKCTSDHIFLLQTMIKKVVKKGKKKIVCELHWLLKGVWHCHSASPPSAFGPSTHYRESTLSIVINSSRDLGINGLLLENITSMYEESKYAIKLNKGYLEAIDINLELKKGCPLSLILFNLYIDDINIIFKEHHHPIQIQDVKINHFPCMLTT